MQPRYRLITGVIPSKILPFCFQAVQKLRLNIFFQFRMSEIPAACPGGPGSEMAGKASACEGCPSRKLCESAPKGPDPDIAIIGRRLSNIKRKLVVISGKGGVGKSTVTALLTRALASDEELGIGLLDIDMTGPSADLFMGLKVFNS